MNVVLTHREKLFCREYIIDFNAAKAAKRAGCTPSTASYHAKKLLRRNSIKQQIDYLVERRSKRLDITAERVLQEYAKIAFVNVDNFYDNEGFLLPFDKIAVEDRSAIAGLTYDNNYKPTLKIHDKVKALDTLAKHLGLYQKDNEQGKDTNTTPKKRVIIARRSDRN